MIRRRRVKIPFSEYLAALFGRRCTDDEPARAVLTVELSPGEWDMFDRGAAFTVAPAGKFAVRWLPGSDDLTYPFLICAICGIRLIKVDDGDDLDLLNNMAAAHVCPTTATGHVVTASELDQWAAEADRGYDVRHLTPVPGGYADAFRRSELARRIRAWRAQ